MLFGRRGPRRRRKCRRRDDTCGGGGGDDDDLRSSGRTIDELVVVVVVVVAAVSAMAIAVVTDAVAAATTTLDLVEASSTPGRAAPIKTSTREAFASTTTRTTMTSRRERPLPPLGAFRGRNDKDGGGGGVDRGFNLLEIAGDVIPQGVVVKTARDGWRLTWRRFMTELAPQDKSTGDYRRPSYDFDAGRIGSRDFPDVPGRYHVYVGNPCPWCHRVLLALLVLGVDTSRDVTVTRLIDDPVRASRGGWVIPTTAEEMRTAETRNGGGPLFCPDPLNCRDLRRVYDACSPGFRGRCTAPLIIDKKTRTIVSNESVDIVRMINDARFGKKKTRTNEEDDENNDRIAVTNLYPREYADEIRDMSDWIYRRVNNGVYRCGFSTTQTSYDGACADVREGLRRCESILSRQTYLCHPDAFTAVDLLLLPTALRYDGVYGPLFRAGDGVHVSLRSHYPNLHRWMKHCWENVRGVRESIDLPDACSSYYRQLFPLNPSGIVPSPVTPSSLGLE